MDKKEVIEIANECGVDKLHFKTPEGLKIYVIQYGFPEIERFAAEVERRTIERCAKVCEEYDERIETMRDGDYQAELAGRQMGAVRCAAAIRQLGKQ